MFTGEQLYDLSVKEGTGRGFSKNSAIKHFNLAASNLNSDEIVHFVFIGLHNYVSASKHDNNHAYIVTNKRILIAQNKVFGEMVKTVLWDNLNDITIRTNLISSFITFDTIKDKFVVSLDKPSGINIHKKLNDIFYDFKNRDNTSQDGAISQTSQSDPYEELKKAKELLDMGILTQEEFEIKKKNLLNI